MEKWTISKRMEISAAHKLNLPYESKCVNFHGHNYICTVYCEGNSLNNEGMIVDFARIKKEIHEILDHHYLNDILGNVNPTAENMAKWICQKVTDSCETGYCYRVDVQESEGNIASYEWRPE